MANAIALLRLQGLSQRQQVLELNTLGIKTARACYELPAHHLAWADQSYTGEQARQDAQASEIDLQIVKLPEARKGFVLLPRRWVVERSFGWLSRFRRLSRDFERLPQVLASLHFVVVAILMLPKAAAVMAAAGSS